MFRQLTLRRSAAQRIVAPLLVALSVIFIILGKVDQVMLQSVRTSVADYVSPLLDAFSRPMIAVAALTERIQSMVDLYRG